MQYHKCILQGTFLCLNPGGVTSAVCIVKTQWSSNLLVVPVCVCISEIVMLRLDIITPGDYLKWRDICSRYKRERVNGQKLFKVQQKLLYFLVFLDGNIVEFVCIYSMCLCVAESSLSRMRRKSDMKVWHDKHTCCFASIDYTSSLEAWSCNALSLRDKLMDNSLYYTH